MNYSSINLQFNFQSKKWLFCKFNDPCPKQYEQSEHQRVQKTIKFASSQSRTDKGSKSDNTNTAKKMTTDEFIKRFNEAKIADMSDKIRDFFSKEFESEVKEENDLGFVIT